MTERILIIGASARAAAASALRAGFQVVAADLFADADLRQAANAAFKISEYPEGFEQVLRSASYDHWMITGALENYANLIDKWRSEFPNYRGCDSIAIASVRSNAWQRVLQDHGVYIPCEKPIDPCDSVVPDGWLCKRRRSAGGMHVLPPSTQILESHDDCYLQKQIDGEPVSATFVASDDSCFLLGTCEQLFGTEWNAPSTFAHVGAIGPLHISDSVKDRWQTIGDLLAERCGLRGVFGVDAIQRADVIIPIEVNPRYPSSAELFDRANPTQSVVALHIAACTNQTFAIDQSRTISIHGKAIVWATSPVVVTDDLTSCWLKRASEVRDFADIPQPTTIAAGQPVMTIFATGETPDDVARKLRAAIANLRLEGIK
ncbi:MAG: ATP-grasp domain-containing protein [Planctomycetales bacterium]|nr:ATP-grasp domain-containing protein [Planctomycetales bacterium]